MSGNEDDPVWREANPGTMARLLAERYVGVSREDDLDRSAELYGQIVEWLCVSYAQDGYSDDEIEVMDVAGAADELIRRASG